MAPAEFFGEGTIRTHFLFDLLHVIEVVRERGVDVGERNSRDVKNDLVRAHALVFMPGGNVLDADAMARNVSPPATEIRGLEDSFPRCATHNQQGQQEVGTF